MRALRWRAATSVLGALLVMWWVIGSGRTSYIVQIDFAMQREILEGATVEIDGDSVGTLVRYGRSQFVTGFEVEPGERVIGVRLPDCEPSPKTVDLGPDRSRLAVLLAEAVDEGTCKVVLW